MALLSGPVLQPAGCLALAVLQLAGCVFAPDLGEGALACGPGCPPDYVCGADGRCHRAADAGALDAGALDADPPAGDQGCAASCAVFGAECGRVWNGCGRALDCGHCSGDHVVCGGAGPNRCGLAACMPASCKTLDACGQVSNGCNDVLDCGPCN